MLSRFPNVDITKFQEIYVSPTLHLAPYEDISNLSDLMAMFAHVIGVDRVLIRNFQGNNFKKIFFPLVL